MMRITRQQSREVARRFIQSISDGRDWTLRTVDASMPSGFYLTIYDPGDMCPITIGHVADVIYRNSVFEPEE